MGLNDLYDISVVVWKREAWWGEARLDTWKKAGLLRKNGRRMKPQTWCDFERPYELWKWNFSPRLLRSTKAIYHRFLCRILDFSLQSFCTFFTSFVFHLVERARAAQRFMSYSNFSVRFIRKDYRVEISDFLTFSKCIKTARKASTRLLMPTFFLHQLCYLPTLWKNRALPSWSSRCCGKCIRYSLCSKWRNHVTEISAKFMR